MRVAALVAALVAAGGGITLVVLWLSFGGARQRKEDVAPSSSPPEPDTTHLSPWMVATHAVIALTVIGTWIVYMVEPDRYDLAPGVNTFLLLIVVGLGLFMYRNWHMVRRNIPKSRRRSPGVPAERRFPAIVVWAHGLAGITTLALVALVALGVGVGDNGD